MMHLCNEILRFSSPNNFYGGVGENKLKLKCKQHTRKAKKTETCSEKITAKGHIQQILLTKALNEIHPKFDNISEEIKSDRIGLNFLGWLTIDGYAQFSCKKYKCSSLSEGWGGPFYFFHVEGNV